MDVDKIIDWRKLWLQRREHFKPLYDNVHISQKPFGRQVKYL